VINKLATFPGPTHLGTRLSINSINESEGEREEGRVGGSVGGRGWKGGRKGGWKGGRKGGWEGRREAGRGRDKEMGSESAEGVCVCDNWREERIRTGRQCPSSGNLKIHN